VADFIRSQNRKKIPRHLLLRRFNNKREADLERIHDLLKIYGISYKREQYRGKKTGRYLIK